MVERIGDNFRFVSTLPIPQEFLQGGYENYENINYNICTYRSSKENLEAYDLGKNSDVVMFGSTDVKYLKERIASNALTFIYSERLFKRSKWMKFNPRVIRFMFRFHTRFRNKNLHLLCSSGFVANDMKWVFAYPKKMYKWGYFTEVKPFPIKLSLEEKNKDKKLKILWVARFIPLKHPMLVISLAKYLKSKGYSFEITMIGNGELFKSIEQKIREVNLVDKVILAGNKTNSEVLRAMRESHIFLMTSNRKEGWGAVLNEALSNGCTVVASSEIGSAPYLIEPEKTGLIFKSKDVYSLIGKVEYLINNSDARNLMALRAYQNMKNIWSPANAANNILQLAGQLLSNKFGYLDRGPCSEAIKTKESWYLNEYR